MRILVDRELERPSSKASDVVCGEPLSSGVLCVGTDAELGRASPAEAIRVLFGAAAIGAMPKDRTEIRKVGDLGVRAEQTSRTPEACSPHSDMPRKEGKP